MTNITGTANMTYNAASRRLKTRVQQDFADRRIDGLSIQSDMCRLSYVKIAGAVITIPYTLTYGGGGYANLFTDDQANPHPHFSTLNTLGTKWVVIGGGTQIKYDGEASLAHYYATTTIKANTTNKIVASVSISNDGGTTYTAGPPVVSLNTNDSGSGAEAEATVSVSGAITGITITKPGSGYSAAPTVAFDPAGSFPNAAAGTAILEARTVINLGVFIKALGAADFILLNPSTVGNEISDPSTISTSTCTVSFMAPLNKGDIVEIRMQNNGTRDLAYTAYNMTLSLRPIALTGGVV